MILQYFETKKPNWSPGVHLPEGELYYLETVKFNKHSFDLTRAKFKTTIYKAQEQHVNHYTMEVDGGNRMREEQIFETSTLFSGNAQILFEENHGPSGYYASDMSTRNDNIDEK